MKFDQSILNNDATFTLKGVFSSNSYHEFVISLTNVEDFAAFSWVFDLSQVSANKVQLILFCLVVANHLNASKSVKFILSKEHEQWIKWFEPVWSSRINYEVVA